MDTGRVVEVLRQVEFVGGGPKGRPRQCQVCGGWEGEAHHYDDCKLAALLNEAAKEIEYPALVAIANTAKSLRRNADMLRVTHSNADYIPAYLLGPLYEVLDDFDALDKEQIWEKE